MKLNEIKAAPGFEDLNPKMDLKQQDESEAKLIMFKFLSIIEDTAKEKKISRKQLACLIQTSASNITQLFRGNRLINLMTLAKLERVLDIEFKISTYSFPEKKTINIIDLDNFSIKNLHGDRMPTNITTSFGDGHARVSSLYREVPTKEFAQSSAKSFSKTLA